MSTDLNGASPQIGCALLHHPPLNSWALGALGWIARRLPDPVVGGPRAGGDLQRHPGHLRFKPHQSAPRLILGRQDDAVWGSWGYEGLPMQPGGSPDRNEEPPLSQEGTMETGSVSDPADGRTLLAGNPASTRRNNPQEDRTTKCPQQSVRYRRRGKRVGPA